MKNLHRLFLLVLFSSGACWAQLSSTITVQRNFIEDVGLDLNFIFNLSHGPVDLATPSALGPKGISPDLRDDSS